MHQFGRRFLPMRSFMMILFTRLLASPPLLALKGADMGTLYQIRPEMGTGGFPITP